MTEESNPLWFSDSYIAIYLTFQPIAFIAWFQSFGIKMKREVTRVD